MEVLTELEKAMFWVKVKPTESCWEWQGSLNNKGYGTFRLRGKIKLAPRVSYTIINGKIPTGLSICHTCDNPKCVNPHIYLKVRIRIICEICT